MSLHQEEVMDQMDREKIAVHGHDEAQGFISTGLFLVFVVGILILGAAIMIALWPSAIRIFVALGVIVGLILIVMFAGDLRPRD